MKKKTRMKEALRHIPHTIGIFIFVWFAMFLCPLFLGIRGSGEIIASFDTWIIKENSNGAWGPSFNKENYLYCGRIPIPIGLKFMSLESPDLYSPFTALNICSVLKEYQLLPIVENLYTLFTPLINLMAVFTRIISIPIGFLEAATYDLVWSFVIGDFRVCFTKDGMTKYTPGYYPLTTFLNNRWKNIIDKNYSIECPD